MYLMNQDDHKKMMELLHSGDAAAAARLLADKASEQDRNRANHDGTIQCARAMYTDDDCEIDDLPMLSVADKGVWVSAWVWVPIEDEDDEEEEAEDSVPVADADGVYYYEEDGVVQASKHVLLSCRFVREDEDNKVVGIGDSKEEAKSALLCAEREVQRLSALAATPGGQHGKA